ncbi:MAG: hypothetical protein CL524_11680 [Aequorivita sp.]|nr:hypothetical protein [Aequorivita sp.]
MSENQLQLSTPNQSAISQRFEPQSLGELMKFAELVANSNLVPKAFRNNPADIVLAVQMGANVGFSAGQALQNISVINGKATLWGDGMLALILASPVCEDVIEDDLATIEKNQAATCRAVRVGKTDKVCTYTVEQAKRARLWGKQGPWTSDPFRMLQMRARSFALRDQFPDVLRGLAMHEEVRDYRKMAEVQPLKVVLPALRSPQRAEVQVVVDNLIDEITGATNPEELEQIAIKAKDLTSDEKELVRVAYREKLKELQE